MDAPEQAAEWAVLTLLTENRWGITAETTRALEACGVHVEASFATVLGGLYGEYFHLRAAPEDMARLRGSFATTFDGMSPGLHPASPPNAPRPEDTYELVVFAFGRSNIVTELTSVLRAYHVDVLTLSGCSYPAPRTGAQLFTVEMLLDVPGDGALSGVWGELESLADERGWDLELRPTDLSSTDPLRPYPYSPTWLREPLRSRFELLPGKRAQ